MIPNNTSFASNEAFTRLFTRLIDLRDKVETFQHLIFLDQSSWQYYLSTGIL